MTPMRGPDWPSGNDQSERKLLEDARARVQALEAERDAAHEKLADNSSRMLDVLVQRDGLVEALEAIDDYRAPQTNPADAYEQEMQACVECKESTEERWMPPCAKHSKLIQDMADRNNGARNGQWVTLKCIARAALDAVQISGVDLGSEPAVEVDLSMPPTPDERARAKAIIEKVRKQQSTPDGSTPRSGQEDG